MTKQKVYLFENVIAGERKAYLDEDLAYYDAIQEIKRYCNEEQVSSLIRSQFYSTLYLTGSVSSYDSELYVRVIEAPLIISNERIFRN